MERLHLVGIPVAVLILTAACHPPTAPESRAPQDVHVRGQVLAYSGPSEFYAISGAGLLGWVETGGGGRPTGSIPLDENGRFDLVVERGARVRLYAGGTTANEIYQPCAVTICGLEGDLNANVYVFKTPIQDVTESVVALNGDTVLDIDLKAAIPALALVRR